MYGKYNDALKYKHKSPAGVARGFMDFIPRHLSVFQTCESFMPQSNCLNQDFRDSYTLDENQISHSITLYFDNLDNSKIPQILIQTRAGLRDTAKPLQPLNA